MKVKWSLAFKLNDELLTSTLDVSRFIKEFVVTWCHQSAVISQVNVSKHGFPRGYYPQGVFIATYVEKSDLYFPKTF